MVDSFLQSKSFKLIKQCISLSLAMAWFVWVLGCSGIGTNQAIDANLPVVGNNIGQVSGGHPAEKKEGEDPVPQGTDETPGRLTEPGLPKGPWGLSYARVNPIFPANSPLHCYYGINENEKPKAEVWYKNEDATEWVHWINIHLCHGVAIFKVENYRENCGLLIKFKTDFIIPRGRFFGESETLRCPPPYVTDDYEPPTANLPLQFLPAEEVPEEDPEDPSNPGPDNDIDLLPRPRGKIMWWERP